MSNIVRFSVRGTTCTSCEVLLEREIKQVEGVLQVSASHADGLVEIHLAKSADISLDQLDDQLKSHNYSFSAWEPRVHESWNLKRVAAVLLITAAVWYVMEQFGLLDISPTFSGSTGLWAIFMIGVVASLSSCTAVLAGLILALSANHAKRHSSEGTHDRLRPHILFNLGRVIGFAGLGAVVGLLGSILVLSPSLNAVFVLVIAAMMIAIGANLLGLIPKGKFQVRPPKFLAHRIHALQESDHPAVPFVLGALSFFLPCGFTQSVQLYALSTGSPILAASIMLVFALGTVPALFGIGAATSLSRGKTLKRVTQAAGILVLVLGFAQGANGMTLLGFTLPEKVSAEQLTIAQENLILVDGKQLIQMEVASAGFYQPEVLQVVEGIPVEWQIYGPEFMGCFDTLISRGLGIQTRLKTGDNVVRFTPTKVGKHVFSCSMGMSRGTMIVVPNENI
jgi:uncharacterized protein